MVYYYLSPCKHVVTGKDYYVINILLAFVVPSVGHSYLSSNAQCIAAAALAVAWKLGASQRGRLAKLDCDDRTQLGTTQRHVRKAAFPGLRIPSSTSP